MNRQATVDVGVEAFIRCAPWSPLAVRRQTNILVDCARDEQKRFFEPIQSLRDFGIFDDNIDSVCEHLKTFKGTEIAKRVFRNSRHWKQKERLSLLSAVDLSISVEGKNYQAYKAKRIFKGYLRIFLILCRKLIGNDRRLARQLKNTFFDVFKGLPNEFTLNPNEKRQKRKPCVVYSINVVFIRHENLTQHYKAMNKDLDFICQLCHHGVNELEEPAVDRESRLVSTQSSQYTKSNIEKRSATEETETTRPLKFVRIEHEQPTAHSPYSCDTPPASPDGSTHEKAFVFDDDPIVISDDEEQGEQPASDLNHSEIGLNDRCIIDDEEEQEDQQVLDEIFRPVDPNVLMQDFEGGHSDELHPSSSSSSEDNLDQKNIILQNTPGVSTQSTTDVNIPQPPGIFAACHIPDIHPTDRTVTADNIATAASLLTQSFLYPEMEQEILTTAWKSPDVRRAVTHFFSKLMENCSKNIE